MANPADAPALSYNERMLETGMAAPYFIWPNLDPFKQQPSLLDAVPAPDDITAIAGSGRLKTARDLAAAIPGATHLHLPMAGHMLLHEAPHAVTDASRTITTRISAHPLPKALIRLPGQRNSEHAKTA
jgi:hypothetical protein